MNTDNLAEAARTIRDLLAFLTKEQARPLVQDTKPDPADNELN